MKCQWVVTWFALCVVPAGAGLLAGTQESQSAAKSHSGTPALILVGGRVYTNGAFVTPGFNDGHVHVESTGALLTGANLLDVHTLALTRAGVTDATPNLSGLVRPQHPSRRDDPRRRAAHRRTYETQGCRIRWHRDSHVEHVSSEPPHLNAIAS